jgi:hypothetical protein
VSRIGSGLDLRSEILVPADKLRVPHENELDELAALVARGKLLARDARHLVRIVVFPVVKNGIDSGLPYLVARLEHVNSLFGSATMRPKDMRVKLTMDRIPAVAFRLGHCWCQVKKLSE